MGVFNETPYEGSRRAALDRGKLIDVTEVGLSMGFRRPMAITRKFATLLSEAEDPDEMLKAFLWNIRTEAQKPDLEDPTRLNLTLMGKEVVADSGPGDKDEPVFTIGLREEFEEE